MIYRVRTSWEDVKSQKGAFSDLDSAINFCRSLGENYSVFDSNGLAVFSNSKENSQIGGNAMKFNDKNKPIVCMMTQNNCYKDTICMQPVGILWHSTGANNPTLRRYIQPSDNACDRDSLLAIIGCNPYNNDFNHIDRDSGVHAFIGKLADNKTIATIQAMPWNFRPWGCGSGPNGSCNDGWIQFEICEDNLTDRNYFNAVYEEAVQLTAYLCKMYNINPKGVVRKSGKNVPTILCHADSHALGMGNNHGDVLHWFKNFGKTMEDVRQDVAEVLAQKPTTCSCTTPQPAPTPSVPYVVRIINNISVRTQPSPTASIITTLRKGGAYTIVKEVNGWGLLKSYQTKQNGWLNLKYVEKV